MSPSAGAEATEPPAAPQPPANGEKGPGERPGAGDVQNFAQRIFEKSRIPAVFVDLGSLLARDGELKCSKFRV